MDGFISQLPAGFVAIFGFFVLLFVVALVLMVVRIGSRGKAKRRTGPAPSLLNPAGHGDLPDLDLLLNPVSETPPASHYRSDIAELLIIARNLEDGALVVKVGDKPYLRPADADTETKRRLAAILRELAKPADPKPAVEPKPAPVVEPSTSPVPVQTVTPTPPKPETPRTPAPVSGTMPGDLPKFNTIEAIPLKFRGGKPKDAIPEINIAAAIEAYLQFRIEQTPEYAGRHIHVQPSPQGGVQIEVDGRHYDAVADIEDIATRGFLEATIAEWQARQ